MRIRASIAVGVLLLAALSGAGECTQQISRIGESLQTWHESYRELKGQEAHLNSLDRLILTLMLANSKPAHPAK